MVGNILEDGDFLTLEEGKREGYNLVWRFSYRGNGYFSSIVIPELEEKSLRIYINLPILWARDYNGLFILQYNENLIPLVKKIEDIENQKLIDEEQLSWLSNHSLENIKTYKDLRDFLYEEKESLEYLYKKLPNKSDVDDIYLKLKDYMHDQCWQYLNKNNDIEIFDKADFDN
jgi:hypothetical protein